jgi:predicted TIM-barrel fold metal-dependent hydrolase
MPVKAIDIHVHPDDDVAKQAAGARYEQMAAYFGAHRKPTSMDELADKYRAREMMAVLMGNVDVTTSGNQPMPNDHIAAAVKKHPDVFMGFGAVEPQLGRLAIDEVKRCHEELGLRGIGELNPGRQHFYPNDPRYYPIWEECARRGMIVLFHTGMMGAGAGTPGGMGYRLEYTLPIPFLDDLAADIPELQIIGAHPSWPAQEESLAVARHKVNFYIDLSGWAPKYWPPSLTQYAKTILQDKCLFGSDWPVIQLERWLEEFESLDFKPDVRQKIMLDNAKKLLKLDLP